MKIHVNAPSCSKLFAVAAVLAVTTFTSCKKDVSESEEAITTEEAAEIMTESVSPESGGVVAQVESSSYISTLPYYLSACGEAKDSTVAGSGTRGPKISWAFEYDLQWLLSCSNGQPEEFELTLTGNSEYEGPRLSSTHETTASLNITGLSLNEATCLVNETFVRTGAHVSKVGRKLTYTTKTTIEFADLVVNKLTRKIISGVATIALEGTNSAGKAFTYSGTITFDGNSQATVLLKNGHRFLLQW